MVGATYPVGPFRIADADVTVTCNDIDFADVGAWSFQDLAAPRHDQATTTHEFEVRRTERPWVHWGIWRDGEPCETVLDEGYVLFHLQWEFNRIALERQFATIHAAAARNDAGAALLCGASMSGKTTLAGWLATTGWTFLADEIVEIDDQGGLHGYLRPLGIRHGGPLSPLYAMPAELDRRFEEYESLVPVSVLPNASVGSASAPLRLIVFPRYTPGAPTRTTQLVPSEILTELCDASPGLGRHGLGVFQILTRTARSVPGIRVEYSNLDDVAGELTLWMSRGCHG